LPKLRHIECGCGITQYSANCGVLSEAELSGVFKVYFEQFITLVRNVKQAIGSGLKATSNNLFYELAIRTSIGGNLSSNQGGMKKRCQKV
jgi:hypothetical protein